ncbi:MAG: flagellar basal body P-ring protein FlgI [Phycisphaerales bacterium]
MTLASLRITIALALLSALVALTPRTTHAITVQDLALLQGHGESKLWGFGFVVGLQGTGDPSEHLPQARQIAKLLERGGNPVPRLEELAKGKNIAMVMVTATIRETGGKRGDKIDCYVQAYHSAQSLEGGRLFITPLQGALPGQGVYAMAEGPIVLEGPVTTSGVVRAGAQVITDIDMEVIDVDGTFTLSVKPEFAQWTTTRLLANVINQDRRGFVDAAQEIARAEDARTVVVTIPDAELENPANFLGDILAIQLDGSLLTLPAVVQVNEQRGTIVVTGNVTISGVLISSKSLTIQTVTPPGSTAPVAASASGTTTWGRLGQPAESTVARLDDLLQALRAIDMPVNEQIGLLKEIHKAGRLHAAFVTE